ncbi:hypothetical protein SOVF_166680 [Spinacia oleracea]|nr:hypothetical protein SOVF_166680 [Spinacia oleracea]
MGEIVFPCYFEYLRTISIKRLLMRKCTILSVKVRCSYFYWSLRNIWERMTLKSIRLLRSFFDVLNTPFEAVQRVVSSCLSPLMPSK